MLHFISKELSLGKQGGDNLRKHDASTREHGGKLGESLS